MDQFIYIVSRNPFYTSNAPLLFRFLFQMGKSWVKEQFGKRTTGPPTINTKCSELQNVYLSASAKIKTHKHQQQNRFWLKPNGSVSQSLYFLEYRRAVKHPPPSIYLTGFPSSLKPLSVTRPAYYNAKRCQGYGNANSFLNSHKMVIFIWLFCRITSTQICNKSIFYCQNTF